MIGDAGSRIAMAGQRALHEKASRFACPTRAFDGLVEREHVRRSMEIAMKSLGIAPRGAPAHERADPASIAIRGRGLRGTLRPSPA
jgi:hypothetical protein